jgi:hypothetical protein
MQRILEKRHLPLRYQVSVWTCVNRLDLELLSDRPDSNNLEKALFQSVQALEATLIYFLLLYLLSVFEVFYYKSKFKFKNHNTN